MTDIFGPQGGDLNLYVLDGEGTVFRSNVRRLQGAHYAWLDGSAMLAICPAFDDVLFCADVYAKPAIVIPITPEVWADFVDFVAPAIGRWMRACDRQNAAKYEVAFKSLQLAVEVRLQGEGATEQPRTTVDIANDEAREAVLAFVDRNKPKPESETAQPATEEV